mmetsp:Transcript_93654/g.291451  ORF Transcript_93654/g.291451 Transcript_93654/m.291451 type:complete len:264 (+) Transcript_93654:56-847(+)
MPSAARRHSALPLAGALAGAVVASRFLSPGAPQPGAAQWIWSCGDAFLLLWPRSGTASSRTASWAAAAEHRRPGRGLRARGRDFVLRPVAAATEATQTQPSERAPEPTVGVLAKAHSKGEEEQLAATGFKPVLSSFHVFASLSSVHGWGVFAEKDFVEGEVVHESPGRLLRGNASEVGDDIFEIGWDDEDADNLSILGLGFATMHNHADVPNTGVLWERSERHGGAIVGTFYALRSIKRGEELFISYGDDWWASRNLNRTDSR